jgi:hypothetical protein
MPFYPPFTASFTKLTPEQKLSENKTTLEQRLDLDRHFIDKQLTALNSRSNLSVLKRFEVLI